MSYEITCLLRSHDKLSASQQLWIRSVVCLCYRYNYQDHCKHSGPHLAAPLFLIKSSMVQTESLTLTTARCYVPRFRLAEKQVTCISTQTYLPDVRGIQTKHAVPLVDRGGGERGS